MSDKPWLRQESEDPADVLKQKVAPGFWGPFPFPFFRMRTSPPAGKCLNRHLQVWKRARENLNPNPNRSPTPEVNSRQKGGTVDDRRSPDFKLLADLLESLIYDLFSGDQTSSKPFFVLLGRFTSPPTAACAGQLSLLPSTQILPRI